MMWSKIFSSLKVVTVIARFRHTNLREGLCCVVQGGMGVLGQAAGRMDVLDFGSMTPAPMNPEADYMDPAGSDIELSPG